MKYLIVLVLITSCGSRKVALEGRGIFMTKVHLMEDETLKDIKKVKAKFCVTPLGSAPRYSTDLVNHAQKAYKADSIRDFQIIEEMIHPFKICYHLTGIASRIVKKK